MLATAANMSAWLTMRENPVIFLEFKNLPPPQQKIKLILSYRLLLPLDTFKRIVCKFNVMERSSEIG